MSTACVIIIGNEILSGRTQDVNLAYLAVELNKVGVRLREARVIPDVPEFIAGTVNECRATYDYVFTTGGIGPTHDDITAECISHAFGVPHERNRQAEALFRKAYDADKINEARLRMCDMPKGATLIPNPVSVAPGFIIGNVYVMAGVPEIMRAMFDHVKGSLKGGKPVKSITVSTYLTEGTIAKDLAGIQDKFPEVEIGSYPFVRGGKLGTSLVARHEEVIRLGNVRAELFKMIERFGGEVVKE
jgi:molybdenum cofactor synthesis domain-containing protein